MRTSPLFAGMEEEEIRAILGCLDARVERYPKGAYLLRVGDTVESVGLLLAGGALVTQESFWGSRNIMARIGPGQLFAEAFACSPGAVLNIAVAAEAPCTVLFLNVRRILTMCPTTCAHHSRMIRNLLSDLAGKNLRFTEKLTHMGQRTTREKLLSYLSAEAQRCGDAEFDIPYSRQQLADYLSVERSGLSAELCRMRDEGILAFHKNHFKLLATP
ncbi:Crp/Fnr family transcriptional regulator [Intestinimonas massiliensis]|uniref:Crp/Fnr family transcriptional regulator n=1 Tax=Intestinimonas massiliensis (ex Afouda et al. 2020) TaxID=1673721 RepID=A0AAW5JVE9_9FIRM|nr:Crp/Fnr family transcriptional regulator [Intestinimonas massiliensis (ex Afouda et al. 2020)]MCQ4771185.1 Crp/Fnr family transcriptional regulator [Intestinimonas massiliensis (ex Afouda et al. 2020)]